MDPNKYFKIMEQTGEITYRKIEEYLNKEIKESFLRNFIKSFIKGRLQNKRRLRSLLIRGVWECLREDDWKKAMDLYAWVELWCIADYLTNDIFDNKLDKCKTKIKKDPNLFFIASAIVRELAEKVLRNAAKKLNPKQEDKVVKLFSEMVEDAYSHQWVDYTLKYNKQNIKWIKENLKNLFKKRYIDYEAGNVFGKICEISAILICKENCEKKIKSLKNYGFYFSCCLQIVNDIADIADKGYDSKNKLLTYPLLLTMLKSNKNIYQIPSKRARELFVKTGTFDEVRKKALEYMKKAKKELKIFKNRDLLSCALIFAWQNKYYDMLKK